MGARADSSITSMTLHIAPAPANELLLSLCVWTDVEDHATSLGGLIFLVGSLPILSLAVLRYRTLPRKPIPLVPAATGTEMEQTRMPAAGVTALNTEAVECACEGCA
jgi:hypothetical protein